jgi:hypothetical protein
MAIVLRGAGSGMTSAKCSSLKTCSSADKWEKRRCLAIDPDIDLYCHLNNKKGQSDERNFPS